VSVKSGLCIFLLYSYDGQPGTFARKALVPQPAVRQMKSINADDYLADLLHHRLDAGFNIPSYCAYEKQAV
jgi:hypothetical protein